MKIFIMALVSASFLFSQTILFEPKGAIIQVKEKYGCSFVDTVYQIEEVRGQYVLYDKNDRPVGWYPKENHSITVLERIKK